MYNISIIKTPPTIASGLVSRPLPHIETDSSLVGTEREAPLTGVAARGAIG